MLETTAWDTALTASLGCRSKKTASFSINSNHGKKFLTWLLNRCRSTLTVAVNDKYFEITTEQQATFYKPHLSESEDKITVKGSWVNTTEEVDKIIESGYFVNKLRLCYLGPFGAVSFSLDIFLTVSSLKIPYENMSENDSKDMIDMDTVLEVSALVEKLFADYLKQETEN